MSTSNLSKFSLFLFSLMYNYIFMRYFISFNIYNTEGGIFLYLLAIVLVFIVYMLIKNEKLKCLFQYIYKQKILRILLALLMLIEALFLIILTTSILTDYFFFNQNYYLFLFPLGIVVFLISKEHPIGIINFSTLILFVVFTIKTLIFIFMPSLDFTNLLPIRELKITNIYGIVYLLFVMFNSLMLLLLNNSNHISISPKMVMISLIASLLLILGENIIIICYAGKTYFYDYKILGFQLFRIQKVSKFIAGFDFVLIALLAIFTLARTSFNLAFFRMLLPIKLKRYKVLMIPFLILLFLVSLIKNYIKDNPYVLFIVFTVILITLYFSIIFRKDDKNEKRK